MKRNSIIEALRAHVSPQARRRVAFSFQIVESIQNILDNNDMQLKDIAKTLGREEAEIGTWMRGTYNFTIGNIAELEVALGEEILQLVSYSLDKDTKLNL